ncbi:hypothetical protein MARPO_0007s0075 [Marchantia polymorpha]|uniref:Uncharacterized protein n=1 Tax=Marchantia polymorpha TaxID=3197 RepID=A0A2R6XND8_MARPO|nr:hypothetical protein MARPO_0007s0075 [Marchantia polymorpha]|eukprot:PTQ47625.1 hypothetical protein MARPO_0007s0075 [Marchantia polymorpha]
MRVRDTSALEVLRAFVRIGRRRVGRRCHAPGIGRRPASEISARECLAHHSGVSPPAPHLRRDAPLVLRVRRLRVAPAPLRGVGVLHSRLRAHLSAPPKLAKLRKSSALPLSVSTPPDELLRWSFLLPQTTDAVSLTTRSRLLHESKAPRDVHAAGKSRALLPTRQDLALRRKWHSAGWKSMALVVSLSVSKGLHLHTMRRNAAPSRDCPRQIPEAAHYCLDGYTMRTLREASTEAALLSVNAFCLFSQAGARLLRSGLIE